MAVVDTFGTRISKEVIEKPGFSLQLISSQGWLLFKKKHCF